MKVHTLDLQFQGVPGLIAAYLVECGGGELALVETGPGSTLDALRAAIRQCGHDEKAVRHVFVTHIHLDHAGAAGWWAQQGARVYCHANAQRHLVDPARLMNSARLVYGDRLDTLWGQMLPAPAGQVRVLADGETVKVGQLEITAWDTPGHARHHHVFCAGDACFTGDAAGMRLEQADYLSVTAAPPQFDPPAYVASVDRLLAGGFQRLFLTHFGEIRDVQSHLSRYRDRIQEVLQNVREWKAQGFSESEIQHRYTQTEGETAIREGVSEALWVKNELANGSAMCADGVRLYVEKSS